MILRPEQEDSLDQPRVLAGEARCLNCKEAIGQGDADAIRDALDHLTPKPGAWMSECCDAPVYLPDERETLLTTLGPAWAAFVPVPLVLLADDHLTAGAKIVAAVLLDFRNCEEVYPSQSTIAGLGGMSVDAVARALRELEDANLIARSRRSKSNGARTSDRIDVAPLVTGLNRLNGDPPVRPNPPTAGGVLTGESRGAPTRESRGAPTRESREDQERERDQDQEKTKTGIGRAQTRADGDQGEDW